MKVRLKAVWWGALLGLVVVYLSVMVAFRKEMGFGMLVVIVICALIGALIAFPAAEAISQKLMDKLFGVDKGKVSKDYSRAKYLLAEERFEEAIAEFRRAAEEEPENVAPRLQIAEIYCQELHDYRRAIEQYEAALAMQTGDSDRASILNRIADIYESALADKEMAVRTVSRIVEVMPATKFAEKATERIAAIRRTARNGGKGA